MVKILPVERRLIRRGGWRGLPVGLILWAWLELCWPGMAQGQKIKIKGNDFYGNRALAYLVTYPPDFEYYTDIDLEGWIKDLREEILYLYENQGYFDAKINVSLRSTGDPQETNHPTSQETQGSKIIQRKKWITYIEIQEGARYVYGALRLGTIDGSSPQIGAEDMGIKTGDFFTLEKSNQAKWILEKAYGDAGYAKRKVDLEFDFDNSAKTISLDFKIDPSYLVIFDSLIIQNRQEDFENFRPGLTREKFIRSLFKNVRGDTLNLSRINSFKNKLKSTRVFNYVRIKDSLLVEKENRSLVILKAEERIPGSIGGNIFWETEDGFGIGGFWTHKNILGKFYQGDGRVRLAQRNQSINIGVANPLLFGLMLRLDNDLELRWRQDIDPEESPFDAVLSSSLSRAFGRRAQFLSKLEFVSTTERAPDPDPAAFQRQRVLDLNWISSLKLAWLDDKFNPRKGTQFLFIHGNGGPLLDAAQEFRLIDIRHNWFDIRTSYYYPLLSNYIAAVRLNSGSFFGKGRTNSRRFFLGGRSSIRNAEFRSICPEKRQTGSETYCREDITPMYVLSSLELRAMPFYHIRYREDSQWSLFKTFQVVPFADWGRVWNKGNPLNEESRGFAVGLGVRIPVFLFNLRTDYAVGWDEGPKWGESQWIFDLTQAF